MAGSLNKAMLIGNLGADPEIRSIASGTRVANLSVATNRSWTGRDGQKQEKTEWHRVVVWESERQPNGGLFGIVDRYLKKGDRVYVEGEIEYRSYEDKDGVTKYSTEIRARDLVMLGGADAGRREPVGAGGGGRKQEDDPDYSFPEDEDDLPF